MAYTDHAKKLAYQAGYREAHRAELIEKNRLYRLVNADVVNAKARARYRPVDPLVAAANRSAARTADQARRRARLLEQFWDRVDQSGGPDACWPWMGNRALTGYGRLGIRSKLYLTHRHALELALGRPIGPGMEAMHSCDNPPCCNPAHLSEGTHADNMADFAAKGRWWSPRRLAYLERRTA